MNNEENDIDTPKQCDLCGGALKSDKIKLEEFDKGKLYVINDAPALTCEACGEIWVPETVISELEQMMKLTQKKDTLKFKKITKKVKKKNHSKRKPLKQRSK